MKAGKWICVALAMMLLTGGGCERRRGHKDGTDLCWAAYQGNLQKVQSLIARGVSVHATDYQGQTPLHNAAEGGHIDVVQFLLRSGASIDPLDKEGCTPAMLGMAEDHRAIAECLVSVGAAVDLHLAAYLGDTARLRQLLAGGVDVNAKGPNWWTALYYAVSANQREAARLLIAAGADLNAVGGNKHFQEDYVSGTALHRAVAEDRSEFVEMLIDGGADVEARDEIGMTPMCSAVGESQSEMVKLLLAKGASPDAPVQHDRSHVGIPLEIAILGGHVDIVETLIAAGADVNAKDTTGWTLLHAAVTTYYPSDSDEDIPSARPRPAPPLEDRDHLIAVESQTQEALALRMVDLLLTHGADVNGADEDGVTPLHCAAYHGRRGVVEFLLAKGANVNAKTTHNPQRDYVARYFTHGVRIVGFDVTPLHQAAFAGDPNIVDLLLAHGAKANAVDDSGHTPLHYAALGLNADTVERLVAKGADVNAADKNGATPLVVALRNGRLRIVKALLTAGAKRANLKAHFPRMSMEDESVEESLLHQAFRTDCVLILEMRAVADGDPNTECYRREWVEMLLANGADPNQRDERGNTPLHAAILAGDEESAGLLVARGADIQARNDVNLTPLHLAAADGRQRLVSLFLAKGAEVNARDDDGDTPLHSAARQDRKDVAELLLSHGADPTARNSRDRTPLDEATRRGHDEVVQLLTTKPAELGAAAQRSDGSTK